jgi:6-phosphogluconate dehydrogenase
MSKSEIGLLGLGTMGAALSLNIAEKGFALSVYNRTSSRTDAFMERARAEGLENTITPTDTLKDFVNSIAEPRSIILMIPSGDIIDDQIKALRALMGKDDLIIDAANALFHNTTRRAAEAVEAGVPFLGIGVSGGEEGARHGPSIMGGGERSSWDRVRHILKAISARYEGIPCATYMGEGGAGHFVKAVHNGIEYADMQMISEVYGILRDGMGKDASACGEAFEAWNEGPLQGYLIEISGKVSKAKSDAGGPLLDIILDKAGQKGTGRWTVIEAQHLGAPIPVIEAAVCARNISALLDQRHLGETRFGAAPQDVTGLSLDDLEGAMIAGKIMCYAQGFELLRAAGEKFEWSLPMPAIAEVWREGCIIRSTMLNDMATALTEDANRNLMLAPFFANLIETHAPALRKVVSTALAHGLPVPALAAGLTYFDMMRTARSTANMIQGQRDFFGLHGFERLDKEGTGFHGPWAD